MTVGDVPIDVTAKSAAAARDRAIADVQAKAFDRLIKRLVPGPADQARIRPSQEQIEGFVQDFAVESERTSPVRYIGLFSVRFRSGAVRKFLSDSGVTSIGDLEQVVILPVYRGSTGAVLWGQDNAWRAAWDRGGFGDGPVTLILPNGDSIDTGALSAAAATSGDTDGIGALIARYHASGLVVVEAAPHDPARGPESGLNLTASIYDLTGAKGVQSLSIDAAQGERPDKILLRGVAAIAGALEAGWQQAITAGGSIGLVGRVAGQPDEAAGGPAAAYAISMPIGAISDWVAARDRLLGISGVQSLSLDALSRDAAAMTLVFAGDTLALEAALSGSGFELAQLAPASDLGPGIYALRRVGPGAR